MITLNRLNNFYVNLPNDATGTVEYRKSDEESPISSQIAGGKALISNFGTLGIYPEASIRYSGDSKYYPSEIRDLVVVWQASGKDISQGKVEKIAVRFPNLEGYPSFTGSVRVSIVGVDYSAPIISNHADVEIESLPAGDYTALITYLPDTDDWLSFSTTVKFTVKPVVGPVLN